MGDMQKKNLVTFLSVFLSVSSIVFIGITQILGIPFWWIFGSIYSGSIVTTPRLLVTVSPETPLSIGETITVAVTNSSSRLPVQNAEVSVMKNGMKITLSTDSQGQVFFEYFGEVTVVTAQKTGIDPSRPIAIPKTPDIWIRNAFLSLGIAILGGFVSGFSTYILQQRKRKTPKKKTTRKSKRKETAKK